MLSLLLLMADVDVGSARVVEDGKLSADAKAALDKALTPTVTTVTVIVCTGDAPQTPVGKAASVGAEATALIASLRPKMPKSWVGNALDATACPTGLRLQLGTYDLRGVTGEAKVVAVSGQVVAHTRDGHDVPLFKDSVVPQASEVRTEARARCELQLKDGTRVIVRENARLLLEALDKPVENKPPLSRLKLTVGKIWSLFKGGGTHNLEVETPTSVAGVRGTEFQVGAKKGESALAVYDGKVGIEAGGKGQEVPKGFAIIAQKTLGPLRPLPPAPENLMPRVGKIQGGVARVKWDPVKGAVGYRVEIARDVTFTSIFLDQNFKGNQIRIEAKPGTYYWRVFARDEADIESNPSKLYALEFE